MVNFKIGDFRIAYHKAKLALCSNYEYCKIFLCIDYTCCSIIAESRYNNSYYECIKEFDYDNDLQISIELTDDIVDFLNSEIGINYTIEIDKIDNNLIIDIPYLGKSKTFEYKEYQNEYRGIDQICGFYFVVAVNTLLKPINKAINRIRNTIEKLGISYKFRDNKYYINYKNVDIELSLHLEISRKDSEIYFEFVYKIKLLSNYDFNEFYENNKLFNLLTDKDYVCTIEYNSYDDIFTIIHKKMIKCRSFSLYDGNENVKMYIPINILTLFTLKGCINKRYGFSFMLSKQNDIMINHQLNQLKLITNNIEL